MVDWTCRVWKTSNMSLWFVIHETGWGRHGLGRETPRCHIGHVEFEVPFGHPKGFPGGSNDKASPAVQETWVRFLGQKLPWGKEWQPTPVFWPGDFHGKRSLAGYTVHGLTESDMTE